MSLFLYWFPFTLLSLFRCRFRFRFRFLFPFPLLFQIPVSSFTRCPTATVQYTFSKHNSSPQTHTSLLLPDGLFLKSPGTFLGLESCFMFSTFYIQDKHFNPLSPNIHVQILQTDLHTFP